MPDESMNLFREAVYKPVPLADMKPAAYNPRLDLKPGDVDYEKLRASLLHFGNIQPIVWNEVSGNIVGGHQRYKILLEMGAEHVVCAVVHYETEQQEKAANLALNRARGRWDEDLLHDMFARMDRATIDHAAIGFNEDEIEHALLKLDGLDDADIFDYTLEPDKKAPMITCPCCGRKFVERDNRV